MEDALIQIKTIRDIPALIDGYNKESNFSDLCAAIWHALGETLGQAVCTQGSLNYYAVEKNELSEFCRNYVGQ